MAADSVGKQSIVMVAAHVAFGTPQPVNTEVFVVDVAHSVAVHDRPGHSEFRWLAIARYQPSRNRRQPQPVLSIPFGLSPLQLVPQVVFSRHWPLTQSVRRPGPVEGYFPAIQLGNGSQSATCA